MILLPGGAASALHKQRQKKSEEIGIVMLGQAYRSITGPKMPSRGDLPRLVGSKSCAVSVPELLGGAQMDTMEKRRLDKPLACGFLPVYASGGAG